MKHLLLCLTALCLVSFVQAASPVGKWKRIANTVTHEGKKLDMHAALLQQRPCAADIVYEFAESGKVVFSAPTCDEPYRKVQEKLWSKTKWKLDGDKILTSSTNFAVANTYKVAFSGNKMTWSDENGEIVYQKL